MFILSCSSFKFFTMSYNELISVVMQISVGIILPTLVIFGLLISESFKLDTSVSSLYFPRTGYLTFISDEFDMYLFV